MLKISFNDSKVDIAFDLPIDHLIEQEQEFQKLSQLVLNHGMSMRRNTNGHISGMEGPLMSFLEMIEDTLPGKAAMLQREVIQSAVGSESQAGGLQINFHQKPFDTPYRHWMFILRQGHFINYFFNRINWYIAPINKYVMPFPLHVDLESASTCNMNCPMCYRDQMKSTGQMDLSLFKKAVDECAANDCFSIRLSWRGETLTHPRIQEMIAYATHRVRNVSFLTNAFYLDDDMIICLIKNRVNYISVSFDGIGKVYESIRHPAVFEENYNRLAHLLEERGKACSLLPQVRLCTIWPAIRDNPQEYYDTMSRVSDFIVCNPYINFRGPMQIKPDFICQYPWERIVTGYDGQVQCCTGWNADDIILGNLSEHSIRELWHSDLMKKIREAHASGKRMELDSCARCRHGSDSDPAIDIREILERRY